MRHVQVRALHQRLRQYTKNGRMDIADNDISIMEHTCLTDMDIYPATVLAQYRYLPAFLQFDLTNSFLIDLQQRCHTISSGGNASGVIAVTGSSVGHRLLHRC